MSGFEDEHFLFFGVFKRTGKRIGRLLVVVEHVVSTGRLDFRGHAYAEPPSSHVHLVDALVAHVAVAVVPVPMPVVVKTVGIEGTLWSRAEPEIIVDAFRNGAIGFVPDRISPFIAQPSGHIDLADDPLVKLGDAFADCVAATALGSVLAHSVILLGGVDQLTTFPDVVAARLFDVDILTSGHRGDSDQCVRVVARCDGDNVDVGIFDELSVVVVLLDFPAGSLFELRRSLPEDALVDVANCGNVAAVQGFEPLDVGVAFASCSDGGNADRVVGRLGRFGCRTAGVKSSDDTRGKAGSCGERKKLTSSEWFLRHEVLLVILARFGVFV